MVGLFSIWGHKNPDPGTEERGEQGAGSRRSLD